MKEAIQKAIEGGYNLDGTSVLPLPQDHISANALVDILAKKKNYILLDPLFWQALSKGMPLWNQTGTMSGGKPTWHYVWHQLIDHLASGKSAESFFNELFK